MDKINSIGNAEQLLKRDIENYIQYHEGREENIGYSTRSRRNTGRTSNTSSSVYCIYTCINGVCGSCMTTHLFWNVIRENLQSREKSKQFYRLCVTLAFTGNHILRMQGEFICNNIIFIILSLSSCNQWHNEYDHCLVILME